MTWVRFLAVYYYPFVPTNPGFSFESPPLHPILGHCTMADVKMQPMSPDQDSPDNNAGLMYTTPESQHSAERSPLSNFGFLKNLGLDKKPTKGMMVI